MKKNKKISMQGIRRALLDPEVGYKVRQKTTIPGIVTASERLMIRMFARKVLPVMRQDGTKLTEPELTARIITVLRTRRPEVRKVFLSSIKEYMNEGS